MYTNHYNGPGMCNVETTSIYFTLIEEKGCRVVEQQQLIIFSEYEFLFVSPPVVYLLSSLLDQI
jgi:hypothetical protein